MHKFLLIITICVGLDACDNNNNISQEIIKPDNRFHVLKDRYADILKGKDLFLKAANADGSMTFWLGFDTTKQLYICLTPQKETDFVSEGEHIQQYNSPRFEGNTIYAFHDFKSEIIKLFQADGKWDCIKRKMPPFSTVYVNSNRIYLAGVNTVNRYTNDLSLQQSWHFHFAHHIQSMTLLNNKIIASEIFDGIFELDLETNKAKKILPRYYGHTIKISPNQSYFMGYFYKKRYSHQPAFCQLRVLNMQQKTKKGRYSIEFSILDRRGQIVDFNFLPHNNDLFFVSYNLKQGGALYSLANRSRIARIHTDTMIDQFIFPSKDEILLKVQGLDAQLVNVPALLAAYYQSQSHNGEGIKPLIVGTKKTKQWNQVTDEEIDREVYGAIDGYF